MKTISILLALVNSLAASLVIAASLPTIQLLRPAASLWNAAKVTAGIGIIAAGILTWFCACGFTSRPQVILLTSLFLVVLGTAAAVWTIHLGLVRGNLEDQMLLFGGSLAIQGTLSIWGLVIAGDEPISP